MSYRPRAVDRRIARALGALGAVVLEGPRACGKTATGLEHARSSVRLDSSAAAIELADLDPRGLLEGEPPLLVDEWQLAPALWNVIRHEIDQRRRPGQFILSGSVRPPADSRRHSGAGRFARVRMRPMTFHERGLSSAQVSLSQLSATDRLTGVASSLTYRDLASQAVRGGWPGLLDVSQVAAREFTSSYLSDLASTDVSLATGVRHDPQRVRRLLISLARNVGSEVTIAKLVNDVAADGSSIDRATISTYLDALNGVFALEEQPAWSASLRSRTRLRSQAKLHFTDPSLACAALRLTPDRLARDPEFFGHVFESLVVQELRTALDAELGHVYHYRDATGLEVDAILEFGDGGWAAVEVKLGSSRIPEAESNLLTLCDQRVDVERMGAPRFLAVVTGTARGYTLPSGVHVVPLGSLAP